MKSLFLIGAIFLSAISSLAGTCKLEKPFPFSGDLLGGVQLHNVVLDEIPQFLPEDGYDPAMDSLSVSIFNIEWNFFKMNFVGARMSIDGKDGAWSLGFAERYSGNFKLAGSLKDVNGVKTYSTTETFLYTAPEHAKIEAITETVVTVVSNQITALTLKYPIFKVWYINADGNRQLVFTGDHQTVCVKSAN